MGVRLRLTLVAALAALAAPALHAEPVGRHFELTPLAGYTLLDGKLHSNGNSLANDLYLGGRLGYEILPWLSLEAAAGLAPTNEDVPNGGDVTFFHASGNAVFTPWAGRWGGPYAFVGKGTSRFSPASGSSLSQTALETGGGLRMWMTDALGVRVEMRQLAYSIDDAASSKDKIHHMIVTGGIVMAIGSTPRDTDGDGVPDRKDTCPDTPHGATVDKAGCPKDSDGDGVLDGIDKCPDTPKGATVDKLGCPKDSDGDGVLDGLDTCADTPKGATVDAKGCPSDGDGDGVLDGIDQCPGTTKGCTVDEKGCEKDSDGDGVCDGLDQCPDTQAGLKVDAQGCPIEVIEKETELLDTGMIRLQNVTFETDKTDLLPESLPVLDVVGAVLSKWPELKVEIGGHTDARGSNAHNQKLSEGRAEAVRTYLVGKYPQLKAEQYTVKGYGESTPLVPNTSEPNMAKNRRVEFVVKNPSVLKHEVERRQMLKKGAAPLPGTAPSDTLHTTPALPDSTR